MKIKPCPFCGSGKLAEKPIDRRISVLIWCLVQLHTQKDLTSLRGLYEPEIRGGRNEANNVQTIYQNIQL